MILSRIYYSYIYRDNDFEYTHVILPPEIAYFLPRQRLLIEWEWRELGVDVKGWDHYMIHAPEPHILLFRRPLPKAP